MSTRWGGARSLDRPALLAQAGCALLLTSALAAGCGDAKQSTFAEPQGSQKPTPSFLSGDDPASTTGTAGAAGSAAAGPGISAAPTLGSDVNVVITADNAYGFGYGTDTTMINYFGGVENRTSSEIFDCPVGHGAEAYTVPAKDANAGGYLYIIGYADRATTQGVLAKFFRAGATPVFSGAGPWQACATGEDYDPGSKGPTLERINAQIANCNAGQSDLATTSAGWVTTVSSPRGVVAVGESNNTTRNRPSPGNEFLVACGIDEGAQWMWYDWEPARTTGSPFMWPGGEGNVIKDFIIFRLGAQYIPAEVN